MKFKVQVIEATDLHDAKKKAQSLGPDLEFPAEHDYEYGATIVQEEKVA